MMYFFFTNEIIRDLLNMKCNKLKLIGIQKWMITKLFFKKKEFEEFQKPKFLKILILENEEISQFDFYFL